MDDPGSLNYYNEAQNNPALQGWKGRDLTPEEQKRWEQYSAIANQAGPDQPGVPQGHGLSYVTADPALRREFMGASADDERQHYGDVIQGPNGPMQTTYRDPPKPNFGAKYMPLAFGAALSAISGGAAAPFLAPLFTAATQYGSTGKLNAKNLALSLGGSMLGGAALGGLDPGIAQAINYGKTVYGLGKAGYDASKGNY